MYNAEQQLEGVVVGDEFLGYGSFCCVKQATQRNGRKCAVKFLQENQARNPTALQKFRKERRLLSRIRHPHIVGYYGAAELKKNGCILELLVLELLSQDLHEFLESKRRFSGLPFYQKVNLCCDIAEGLDYLHSQHPAIIHRDLSDTNILISLSGNRAKISDFGMAHEIDIVNPPSPNRLTPNPGSSPYMPPEARGCYPRYNTGIDVFAFGVLVLQIDVLHRPNPGPETREIVLNFAATKPLIKIVSERERRQEHLQLLSADDPLREIIFKCLEDTQEERPTAAYLCLQLGAVRGSSAYANSYSPQSAEEDIEVVRLREQNAQLKREKESMEAELRLLRSQVSLGQPSTLPVGGRHPTVHTDWAPDAFQAGTTICTPGSTTSHQPSEPMYHFSGASSISSAGSMSAPPAMNISIYNFNYSSSPPPPHSLLHHSPGHNSSNCSSSSLPHSLPHHSPGHNSSNCSSSSLPHSLLHHSPGHNSSNCSSSSLPHSFMHHSPGHNSSNCSSSSLPHSFMHHSPGHNSSMRNCSSSPPPPHSLLHHSPCHNSSNSPPLPHSLMHCSHDRNHSLSSSPPNPIVHHSSTDCAQPRSRMHHTRGSAGPEWYSAKQPVMLLGPLKEELEKMLIRDYPDRYTYCTVYTTGPVAAQRSGKHSYQLMDASVVWRHVQEGSFSCLFQADGKIEGISYAEVIRILSEGIHCLLPENRRLVENLRKRNICPLVICIVPNSPKAIVDAGHSPRMSDASLCLHQVHELKHAYRDCLTATVKGDSLEELCTEVRILIDSYTSRQSCF